MINSIVENRQELEECFHDSIAPEVALLDFEMLSQLRDYLKECFELRLFVSVRDAPSFSLLLPARQSIKRVGNRYLVNDLAPLKPRFEEFMDKIKV